MQIYKDKFYLYQSLFFIFIGSLFLAHSQQTNFSDKGEYQVAAFLFILGIVGHSYFSYSGLFVNETHLIFRKLFATKSIGYDDIAELKLDVYKKATNFFPNQDLLFLDEQGQVILRMPTEFLGRKNTQQFLKLILNKKPQINKCKRVNNLLNFHSRWENPRP